MIKKVLMVLFLMVCLVSQGRAHLRDYLVNYGYSTTPQGMFEIEYFGDYVGDQGKFKSWKQQVEFEYGITDHLVAGIYGVFTQSFGSDAKFDSSKLELRHRFGEYGEWIVDPALYLEYVTYVTKLPKIEAKLLLSKDVAGWNFVTNLKFYEKSLSPGSQNETGYALGASHPISDKAKLGLEFKGSLDNANKHYIIPGIYITAADNVQVNLGIGFGLTKASDDLAFKSIVELEM